MTRSAASLLAFVALGAAVLFGSAPADPPLRLADLAWERGDYVAALSSYLKLLDSSPSEADFESIAQQTGELYVTTEVTTDGASPQFSPDGRQFTYETGLPSRRRIRLCATTDPLRPILELGGWNAAFSRDGTHLAYFKLLESAELTAAQKAVDEAPTADRGARVTALIELLNSAKGSRIVIRDLTSGAESEIDTGTLLKIGLVSSTGGTITYRSALVLGADGTVIFTASPESASPAQIYVAGEKRAPVAVTSDRTVKTISSMNVPGTAVLFTTAAPGGRGGGRGSGGGGGGAGGSPQTPAAFGVLVTADSKVTTVTGSAPSFSPDGGTIVFVSRGDAETRVMAAEAANPSAAATIRKGPERFDAPAASQNAARVAFQMMSRDDWEIVATKRDGSEETRLTRDIQHDLLPKFIGQDRLLAVTGEPRHRRSFLYDLATRGRTRLFHNNTVRTIAPEYSWEPNPDGTKILIVAERDGDTVSPERGVYIVDLTRKVTREEVRARVVANLAAEEALRAKAKRLYSTTADAVKALVSEASISRIYSYEKALFDFDSKHISRPGNKLAAEYLFNTYQSFGYTPEYQWFERNNALGGRTANVVATLKGTVNPELIYVVSSHYDSVAVGPGADDDSSGTAALLETARIMAAHPQPATIIFASFTGEEAGLLGSREFVRRATADKLRIVGALNNDMVGWANDARLDSTIRYSNAGIRDIQHAAAMQFTNLITYDALYYKGTDAVSYYEAFGDIVGGIGSYPVLSSPHYHQSHDLLENMNHELITEVTKTTVATVMLLASSPSRLTGLTIDRVERGGATLSWTASPESGVVGYLVSYGPASKPDAQQVRVTKPTVTLANAPPGTLVAVKAVNAKGLESWDWARAVVP